MSADQAKPRFEPPPWEQEAFERFQKDREETKVREELNAALRRVREKPTSADPEPLVATEPAPATLQTPPVATEATEQVVARERIPDAQIDAMLVQLRGEEPIARPASMSLINTVCAIMAMTGVYIVIEAALFFGKTDASQAANTLLAAALSFVIAMTGIGFIGGAILLFRKYHK